MSKKIIYKICISGLLIAIGYLLPLLFGNIPFIGQMLLPLHFPVLIAGFVLGPIYGLVIGIVLPLSRSLIFGFPIFYPNALTMAFELGTYGLISGLLFKIFNKKKHIYLAIIISLLISLLFGRLMYGIIKYILCLLINTNFTFNIFIAEILLNSWIGILMQLILIPPLVLILNKLKLIK